MGLLILLGFLILFLLGFPVVLAIAIPAIFYLLTHNLPLDMIGQRLQYSLDSYPLVAVPVFILVGNLMNSTGITKALFTFANTLVGRVHGGLAQVNVFASLIFSGMSGAALADVGGLGQIEIKGMVDKGFRKADAAAITIASATVGPIFPPSIPLIIYGAVTGVSAVKLLVGGIIPGILCTAMLMVTVALLAWKRKWPRAEKWPTTKEIMRDMKPALPALMAPVILISGMLTGYFTPTEAASICVLYILIVSHFYYRELTLPGLIKSALETIKTSCSIMIIIAAASLFGWILAVEKVPQMVRELVMKFGQDPLILLLVLNLFFLIVGMFLDSTTTTLLIIPMLAPPVVACGIDPVHLGLIVIFNLMIGLMTPPMGLSLFMVSNVAQIPIRDVLRELPPYFITLIGTLFLITYFPNLTLWIPSMLK
ncbi:MAG: TRAP transporter large permease [Thermodesulfobacteriota bacterium]